MDYFETQKKVGLLIGLFALLAFLASFILRLLFRGHGFLGTIVHPNVSTTFLAAVLFLGTRHIDRIGVRLFHVVAVLLVAGLAIYDEYDSFYGLGFVIMAGILAYKYGFLEKWIRTKIVIVTVFFLALIEVSARYNSSGESGTGILVILFLFVFLAFVYILYKDEIDRLNSSNNSLTDTVTRLRREKTYLEGLMAKNAAELEKFEAEAERANISDAEKRESFRAEFRITRKEFDLLMDSYDRGSSNKQLGERFNIKESTVKQHMHRAIQKLGASNRTEAHVIIRNYLS